MKYEILPGTDRSASVIALGTAWFGTAIPEEDAWRLLDVYAEEGGNFLDTAHMYAGWVPGGEGKSEITIGRWLKRAGAAPIVATKGADRGMTRKGIREQLAQSLERLGVERVGFYWLHRDDPSVPVPEIIGWMEELRKEGLFMAYGCSNWPVSRIREAMKYAEDAGIRGVSASQIGWSMARVATEVARNGSAEQVFMDDDTLAFHRSSRLPLVAYSSQAGGFFTGRYDPAAPLAGAVTNPNIVRYYGTPDNYTRLRAAQEIAAALGVTPNQVALAYLLGEGFPAFPIVGANSVERVRECCQAADVALGPEDRLRLRLATGDA